MIKFCCSLCGLSHAGRDLLLMSGELHVKDNDVVDPCFYVFDGIKFLLSSMVSKAQGRVEVCNEVRMETFFGDVL